MEKEASINLLKYIMQLKENNFSKFGIVDSDSTCESIDIKYRDINDLINERTLNDLNIDILNVPFKGLTSLKGIEKFKNVIKLECHHNSISSLKGIESLENLEFLSCNTNQISSITEISNLKKLKVLNCANNKLHNFIGIEELDSLKNFIFNDNPCDRKYRGLSTAKIKEMIFMELHLNKEDEQKGKAAIIDINLF